MNLLRSPGYSLSGPPEDGTPEEWRALCKFIVLTRRVKSSAGHARLRRTRDDFERRRWL